MDDQLLKMWGRFLQFSEQRMGNPVCVACNLRDVDYTNKMNAFQFICKRMEEMEWQCTYANHIDGMYQSLSTSPVKNDDKQVMYAVLYRMPLLSNVEDHHCTQQQEDSSLCIMMYGKHPVTSELKFPHDFATFFGQESNFLSKVETMVQKPENQNADLVFTFDL
jgi:hypothetical protein